MYTVKDTAVILTRNDAIEASHLLLENDTFSSLSNIPNTCINVYVTVCYCSIFVSFFTLK